VTNLPDMGEISRVAGAAFWVPLRTTRVEVMTMRSDGEQGLVGEAGMNDGIWCGEAVVIFRLVAPRGTCDPRLRVYPLP